MLRHVTLPARPSVLSCRQGCLVALAVFVVARPAPVAAIDGTVVDRSGNRHDVTDIQIRGSTTLEYYVEGKRRRLEMDRIDRVHIGGNRQDQQAPVVVTLRTGRAESGTIIIDAASSPHADIASGGTTGSDRLTGGTSLGPLFLPLTDVQDIVFEHAADAPIIDDEVDATVIDERGRRFEVENLRFRGDEDFRYAQGRKKRRVALRHLQRLEFGDTPGSELRPVTMTYKTGRVVQGEVDASTVRIAGEVDRVYAARVDSAFTGSTPAGTYAVGVRNVKLILIHSAPDEDDVPDAEADSSATEAPHDGASP